MQAFVVTRQDDLEALYRLRYAVFTAEQNKYAAVADHVERRLVDSLDAVATHIAVRDGDQIIGGLRQVRGRRHATPQMDNKLGLHALTHLPDAHFAFSGRLCIDTNYRGSRALLLLLLENYATARADGAFLDFIFCNPHIIGQYEALGYRRWHRYYPDAQLGYQAPMVLLADDHAHLRACRSPFAAIAASLPTSAPCAALVASLMPAVTITSQERASLVDEFAPSCDRDQRDQVAELIDSSTVIQTCTGDLITPPGTPGREVFVLLRGQATCQRQNGTNDQLEVGSIFGHDILFASGTHTQGVVTTTPCTLLVIPDRLVNVLATRHPAAWQSVRTRLEVGYPIALQSAQQTSTPVEWETSLPQ